ncbi:MAG TPA: spore coat U domain-containing protein [Vicinamibacterales bacterium]|nr:spore coat U domain-containing protein [Vicinamibacterales bacterium]
MATRVWVAAAAAIVLCPRPSSACSFSVGQLDFGTYDVFSAAPNDSTATITYKQCLGSAVIQITVSRGTSATFSPRILTSATETLQYNVYMDAARTTIWGDGSGGTSFYTKLTPGNGSVNVTAFGRITAGQDVGAGRFTDTLTVVMNF